MDRIDAIAVFVAVAEHGSFAAAARRLGALTGRRSRARSRTSKRGSGVRLLTRTTRAVSIDRGRRAVSGWRQRVLADLDEIERAAAGEGTAPRGELRLTAPILFGRLHVLPIVTEFLDRFPEVSVALALVDRPVDLVEEGLDVAVRIGALGGKLGGRDPRRRACAASWSLRRTIWRDAERRSGPRISATHAVVAFSGIAGVEHWVFRDAAGETNVAIRPRLVVTTAEAAIDAARAGFGITRVLSYQAADDVARGSLLRVLPGYEGDEVPIHLVYPGGRHPPPKLRAFLDFTTPRLRRRCAAIMRAINS